MIIDLKTYILTQIYFSSYFRRWMDGLNFESLTLLLKCLVVNCFRAFKNHLTICKETFLMLKCGTGKCQLCQGGTLLGAYFLGDAAESQEDLKIWGCNLLVCKGKRLDNIKKLHTKIQKQNNNKKHRTEQGLVRQNLQFASCKRLLLLLI